MWFVVAGMATANAQNALNFESGPVRPLARFTDTLFVANSPDGTLEIVDITSSGWVHRGSATVGLDPVAIAVVDEHEVWVVNHLSDSISVVDVDNLSVRRTGCHAWDRVRGDAPYRPRAGRAVAVSLYLRVEPQPVCISTRCVEK